MNEIVLLMWGMVGAKCNLTMVSFLAAGDVLTRNDDWHGPSSKKTPALQGAHARARVCVWMEGTHDEAPSHEAAHMIPGYCITWGAW